jgi:hypothetical protein
VIIAVFLSGCSFLKTKLPSNLGLSNSDIITNISSGAVSLNIKFDGKIEKGAILNNFVFIISSGAFNTYLDRMSIFGGKEIYK